MARSEQDVYRDWKRLINMSASELRRFAASAEGKQAGLSRSEASAQGIRSGRDSAQAIIRMKDKGVEKWTDSDWQWARRQVAFVKRMSGNKGPLRDDDGRPTRKLLALKIWGHDPEKKTMKKNAAADDMIIPELIQTIVMDATTGLADEDHSPVVSLEIVAPLGHHSTWQVAVMTEDEYEDGPKYNGPDAQGSTLLYALLELREEVINYYGLD